MNIGINLVKKMVCGVCQRFDHTTYQHRCSECGLNHQKSKNIHSEFDFKRLKLTFNVSSKAFNSSSNVSSKAFNSSFNSSFSDKTQIYFLELPMCLRGYTSTIPLTHFKLRNFEAYPQKTLVSAEVVNSKKCDILILYKKGRKVVVHYDSKIEPNNYISPISPESNNKKSNVKFVVVFGIFLLFVFAVTKLLEWFSYSTSSFIF